MSYANATYALHTVYMKCSPFCANPAYHQIYEQSRLGDVWLLMPAAK